MYVPPLIPITHVRLTVAGDIDLGEVGCPVVDHLLPDDVAAEHGAPLVGRRARPAATQVVHHRLAKQRICRTTETPCWTMLTWRPPS